MQINHLKLPINAENLLKNESDNNLLSCYFISI